MIQFDEEKQKTQLAELRQKNEENFVQEVAKNRGFKYFNLAQVPVETDALKLIPEEEARKVGIAAFQILDRQLGVALTNPDDPAIKPILDRLTKEGYHINQFLISARSLERALEHYRDLAKTSTTKTGSFDISSEEISRVLESVKSVADIQKHIQEILNDEKGFRVSRIVEVVLAGALSVGASDVHTEPEQETVRLRFRIDGVLIDTATLTYKTYAHLLSRIKLISGLKLNVKTEAQDGRFSVNSGSAEIEVRTSIIPGAYGESIVLRILNPESISVSMEELGFEPHLLEVVAKELERPNGMILTTGPTGSGKTTTLYAFLKKVHKPGIKIITIEDPVEYHLEGIVQTQTESDRGYTFSSGLRAILRQDPDIIMVGEIRDNETAEIAVSAASTGHLVFSTLHTNNAAGTFPRLLNLGVNPKVISSSISIALAQRLARKLCETCKKKVSVPSEMRTVVNRIFEQIPIAEYKKLPHDEVFEAVGCSTCNMTGFKGRIGIYEAILMTSAIEKAVLQNPSEREIKTAAQGQGMLTMPQDGIIKVLKGITSLSELARVIDLTEEA